MKRRLRKLARGRTTAASVAFRARIILELAQDPNVSRAAGRLGADRKTVRLWRERFLAEGLKGLDDRPRSGRPVEIDAVTRCEVIALACARPADVGVLWRTIWTTDSLHEEILRRQAKRGGRGLSRTSVLRILNQAELRPHRMRMWLHSPDPLFRPKVTEICDLYLRPPAGEVVLCVDEKTGMQALGRKHPTKPAEPGQDGKFEFEYIRNGTRKLIAAFNPHSGEVYGEMRETRKAADLVEFMEEIARRHPGQVIHIIWDNLNIHYDGVDKRWTRFNKRHGGRFRFHYTPIHASWVNQVELFFSVLARRILRYGEHNSLEELDKDVLGFISDWNAHERKPFRWTFVGYPSEPASKAA